MTHTKFCTASLTLIWFVFLIFNRIIATVLNFLLLAVVDATLLLLYETSIHMLFCKTLRCRDLVFVYIYLRLTHKHLRFRSYIQTTDRIAITHHSRTKLAKESDTFFFISFSYRNLYPLFRWNVINMGIHWFWFYF